MKSGTKHDGQMGWPHVYFIISEEVLKQTGHGSSSAKNSKVRP
jgi:hypothetical protein